MHLGIVTSHPIQYQAPLFRALAERIDLTVYFAHQATGKEPGGGRLRCRLRLGHGSHPRLPPCVSEECIEAAQHYPVCRLRYAVDRRSACRRQSGRGRRLWLALQELSAGREGRAQARDPRDGAQRLSSCQSEAAREAGRQGHRAAASPPTVRHVSSNRHAVGGIFAPLSRAGIADPNRALLHRRRGFRVGCSAGAGRARAPAPRIRRAWGTSGSSYSSASSLPSRRSRPLSTHWLGLVGSGRAVRLVVVGSGPLAGELAAMANARSLPVTFVGFVNQTRMPEVYAAADVLVLPSSSETWGLVVNEAFACGIPAVVSDRVGCGPDMIVEGRTGSVVPVGAVEGLAEADRLLDRQAATTPRHASLWPKSRHDIHPQALPRPLLRRPRARQPRLPEGEALMALVGPRTVACGAAAPHPLRRRLHPGYRSWCGDIVFLVALLIALSSQDPFLTFACISVSPLLATLVWREGEPPVAFAALVAQWLQISVGTASRDRQLGLTSTRFFIRLAQTTPIGSVSAGLLTLAFGIRLANFNRRPMDIGALHAELHSFRYSRVVAAYCIAQAREYPESGNDLDCSRPYSGTPCRDQSALAVLFHPNGYDAGSETRLWLSWRPRRCSRSFSGLRRSSPISRRSFSSLRFLI